jgi:hypothetical protein
MTALQGLAEDTVLFRGKFGDPRYFAVAMTGAKQHVLEDQRFNTGAPGLIGMGR